MLHQFAYNSYFEQPDKLADRVARVNVEALTAASELVSRDIRAAVYSGYLVNLASGSFINNYLGNKKLEHDKIGDVDLWVHYDDFDDAVEIMQADVELVRHESQTVDGYQLRFQVEKAIKKVGDYEIEFCRQRTPIFARQGSTMFECPWKVGDSMTSRFHTYETQFGTLTLSDPYDTLLFYLILGRPKDDPKIRTLIRGNFSAGGSKYYLARNKELGIADGDRVSVRYADIMMSEYRALATAAFAQGKYFYS